MTIRDDAAGILSSLIGDELAISRELAIRAVTIFEHEEDNIFSRER